MRNYSLLDAESRAGYDRGCIALGAASILLAGFFVIGALYGQHPHGVAGDLGYATLAGMLVSMICFMTIMGFNRPRFLVPPHLRGELGSVAGRKRRRREHLPMM